jgi:endonuclease/exonuclease/phosphatase family metal-dependent hydrolase
VKAILLSVLIFSQLFVIKAQSPVIAEEDSLKVLSWNIYMLPVSIKKVGQTNRVRYIAEQFNNSDYDVIVFQEAFDRDARYKLEKLMRNNFPYQEGPANAKPSWFRMNSGVWILSKHPMKFLDEIQFSKSKGVDRVARKGVLLVEIYKNGKTYQIAGTHLQAGEGKKMKETRISQYEEINNLLEKHKREKVPQLICGDFNTPKNDHINYNLMIRTLKALYGPLESSLQYSYDGNQNDLASGGSNYNELLDYIFLKDNNTEMKFLRRKIVAFTARWHSNKKHLSDHYAVEMLMIPK